VFASFNLVTVLQLLTIGYSELVFQLAYVKTGLLGQQVCFDNHQAGTRRFFKRSAGMVRSDQTCFTPSPSRGSDEQRVPQTSELVALLAQNIRSSRGIL